MQRTLTSLTALALTAGAALALTAQSGPMRLDTQKADATAKTWPVFSHSSVTPGPLKITSERRNTVLEEDFSEVPDGDTDPATGRCLTYIASHYYEPGRYIDPVYTPNSGTWEGDWVMAGQGGTVILQTYTPDHPGRLCTPLGDYSGDITVTVRARAAKSFFGASDTETGYVSVDGSELLIHPSRGGYDSFKEMQGDSNGMRYRLYPKDGWVEISLTLHNESADADGYLELSSGDAIEIDYIKVVDNCTFLASPVLLPITDFQPDRFTVNWQPVRRAYNYYLDLWKKSYTAESGINDVFDFEDGQIPEGMTVENCEAATGENAGFESNGCLNMTGKTSTFTSPLYDTPLSLLSTMVKFNTTDPEAQPDGIAYVELLEGDQWKKVYTIYSQFMYPDQWAILEFKGKSYENRYSGMRITTDLTDGTAMQLDDVKFTSDRPYELERVWGPYDAARTMPEDSPYCCYTWTMGDGSYNDKTSFTFTDLDPETEYYYRVRSHILSEFESGCPKTHAFGVATPAFNGEFEAAASHDAYTVRWNEVPKAQNYHLTGYVGEIINEDETEHCILDEKFPNAEGEADPQDAEMLGEYGFTTLLDDYASCAGWKASNAIVGADFVGATDGGQLMTPPLTANPERGSVVAVVSGYGFPGDNLSIFMTGSNVGAYLPIEDDGTFMQYIDIKSFIPGETITFSSLNYMPFGISSYLLYQDVKKGDVVVRWDNEVMTPAGDGQYTFSDLQPDAVYGCALRSVFEHERKTVESQSTPIKLIDLATGKNYATSGIETVAADSAAAVETGRYSLDGRRVSKDYKGVVIVKMSDGTASKQIAR